MNRAPIALDRVQLDGTAIAPRSSTLHHGSGTRDELRTSPWWVYLASSRLPDSLGRGRCVIAFRASTAGSRELGGDVRIVERIDDARGTRLVLAGVAPVDAG